MVGTTPPGPGRPTILDGPDRGPFAGPPGALGPLDAAPTSLTSPYTDQPAGWLADPTAERTGALREALHGVPLGARDEQVIAWLAGWDTATVAILVSLIRRARHAALRGVVPPAGGGTR